MTTSIVMVMVLRKLVSDHKDRIIYASLVIIAANSGGAFSPIGDVTTINAVDWQHDYHSGVIKEIFIPSVISIAIPALILQYGLKGKLMPVELDKMSADEGFTGMQRKIIFFLGVGGLIFVPIFRYITNLPPFMGILLVLSILWITTEIFYRGFNGGQDSMSRRVSNFFHAWICLPYSSS
jgi:Na+/H+ antiporter NhaD/arsenite permease-like protein